MKHWMTKLVGLLALMLGACGAADEHNFDAETQTVEVSAEDLEKADGSMALRVGKLYVQVDPRLRATTTRGRMYYKLQLRVSRPLSTARAWERTGLVRTTTLKSEHLVEIALGDEGMHHVLSGQPLFVELTTVDGQTLAARLRIGARFVARRTEGQFLLHDELVPVRVGSELRLRGHYALPEGQQLAQVFTDDDAEIQLARDGAVDFTPFAVMLAADLPDDPVYFDTYDGAETHHRSTALVRIEVSSFGLTDGLPLDEWPAASCEAEVADCLLERERGDLETEPCGLAPAVDACLGEVVAPPASDPGLFAADLRRELWRLYASEDPVTQAPGAREVDDAVRMVDAALVQYVGPDAPGLERFDPAHVDVWRHRDPISSGRAGHWYGAYDYEGNLLEIWRR